MFKIIYESNVPGRVPFYEVERRVTDWLVAGITHVMIQVDDGRGATWNSAYLPLNPNSYATALQDHVAYYRAQGLKVILTFNLSGLYASDSPVRPDYLLADVPAPSHYYDLWRPEVRQWKVDIINECLNTVYCDAVGLDFVRTGREATSETISPAQVMETMLTQVREVVPFPIIHLANAGWPGKVPPLQGIDVWSWYRKGLVDYSCLFWYLAKWPLLRVVPIDRTIIMPACYDSVTGESKSGVQVNREHAALCRAYPGMAGYSLYLANKFTRDQAENIKAWE